MGKAIKAIERVVLGSAQDSNRFTPPMDSIAFIAFPSRIAGFMEPGL